MMLWNDEPDYVRDDQSGRVIITHRSLAYRIMDWIIVALIGLAVGGIIGLWLIS